MEPGQLKPNAIVRGALFSEPVQVISVIPLGSAIKLSAEQITALAAQLRETRE